MFGTSSAPHPDLLPWGRGRERRFAGPVNATAPPHRSNRPQVRQPITATASRNATRTARSVLSPGVAQRRRNPNRTRPPLRNRAPLGTPPPARQHEHLVSPTSAPPPPAL